MKDTYKDIPEETLVLIRKMLDEDFSFPKGTAEAAAEKLAKKSVTWGREDSFKAAMKFWKNHPYGPTEVILQWFYGVFEKTKGKPPKLKGRKLWRGKKKEPLDD